MAAGREGRGRGEAVVDRLEPAWIGLARTGVFGARRFDRIGTALRSGPHLCSSVQLRAPARAVPVQPAHATG
jgi:hypothetical protein